MLKKQMTGLGVLSSLLAIVGLVLMFASASFGISLGEAWLANQGDGIADTSHYIRVIETYTTAFVVSGSILFAAGLLTAILTYFTFLLGGIREAKRSSGNTD